LAAAAALLALFVALPVIVSTAAFYLFASVIRRLNALLDPKVVSWKELIAFDPLIGWKPKPGINAYCAAELTGAPFHVVTDAEGWPGTASVAASQIVVFGDSFAFGYAIDARSAFSQRRSAVSIKAIGAPGYNMAQELLLMRRYAEQLRGKLVVWFIYYGNDLWENLQPNMQDYRTPFVRSVNGTGDWEIVSNHVNGARWWPYRWDDPLRANERFAGVFGSTFLTRRIYSACEFLITTGKNVCDEAGARLAVVSIPITLQLSSEQWQRRLSRLTRDSTLDANAPDRRIAGICSKLAIRFFAGKDLLNSEDYIPTEGHWNDRGHQRIATLLASLYQERVRDASESNLTMTEHLAEAIPSDLNRSSIA